MKKKLLELLNKKQGIVNRMKSTNEAGDTAGFAAAQNELADVDAEIARVQAIMDAEASVPAPEGGVPQEPGAQSGEGEAVNSAECMHAFAECIRAQARGNRRAFDENADIVRRAAAVENANQMTEGTPADGGLIVPEDVQTTINELRRSLVPLADLFSVENVSFLSGTRVVDTQPTKGFTKMSEMETIPNDDKPVFAKISYKVEDYGLFLPVSNDLLRDTDQALLAYIARWMAKKQVITENNLLVTNAEAVRAASADSVKVWGLPDLGGGASGGTTVKALFTAYYPAANALEGGFLDAQGNRLDPSKKTCAAPPSVAFGTKVTVQGTGTSLDGETYTVNDRGGAIQIENGVYHFDLLMRTNAECNSWGRKTGTAILGGTSGGGSAQSFVNTALGEVGYREGSGNRTKYGAEMGCDGVAWCVIFVCWCAKHSSAPIPTTYTAVSEMRSYFERRGKFKTVASGYKPKAGDLMIIGSSHIGIVLSGGASSCETVEGNYSDGVGRVKRSYSEITGFCCPW